MRKIFFITALLLVACRYTDFEPIAPTPNPKKWQVNMAIEDLRERVVPFSQSVVVEGVVVANDSTGNFYKQIIIVDRQQTSALAVLISYYDSYAQFAIDQVVAVELKGLVLKKVDGLLSAGYRPLDGDTIPWPLSSFAIVDRHVELRGETLKINDIEGRFDELDFSKIGLPFLYKGVYFELPVGVYAGEHKICRVQKDTLATLYTSPYASFAQRAVPRNVFDLRAIAVGYKNKIQLKLLQHIEE